ncbi:MAG: HD domain-containing protein [Bdellovibrionaceae bacterium]|nr:HD domain-containing protein [Pseudobdellovibrionaceae bacterium]
MHLMEFEKAFEKKISSIASAEDPAHDLLHFKRVVKASKSLCEKEGAKAEVVIPAAWLHDFVIIPKNDPRRSQASQISAEAAILFLDGLQYPQKHFQEIAHAIEAHSFSANIEAKTIEAKIVQDADRLDGLGAIGIARCFATSGLLKRPFYSEEDPFCVNREIDDRQFTIDHFFAKLFKTAASMKTDAGRAEGLRRVEVMKRYLQDLAVEIE